MRFAAEFMISISLDHSIDTAQELLSKHRPCYTNEPLAQISLVPKLKRQTRSKRLLNLKRTVMQEISRPRQANQHLGIEWIAPLLLLIALFTSVFPLKISAEVIRHAETLQTQIKSMSPEFIAKIARERGDAKRGAIIFYTSSAGCIHCHHSSDDKPALGPDLAATKAENDRYLVESLTHPSRVIRKGYETHYLLMEDGTSHLGTILEETDAEIKLVQHTDIKQIIVIPKKQIEARKQLPVSGMPEGLLSTFREQRDFMDLVKYLMVISDGGKEMESQLQPDQSLIIAQDDLTDLDHAMIIKKMRTRDFDTGKKIFQGYCFGCHGRDGNQPSLPTARAFGKDKMKFGSDPYSMFQTLSSGNGLMAPMRHLTPKERYQVIHYVREAFMKDSNDDYFKVSDDYLSSLPKGSRLGDEKIQITRKFDPALGSQLGRRLPSVLNIPLGDYSIAYNLHSMDVASVWKGDFVDVSQTQHARDRGEGTVQPKGTEIQQLSQWRWAHHGKPDYPRTDLLPRGPLPANWMDYHGYYRHNNQVVLSYEIDRRPVLEMPTSDKDGITQHLEIGSGNTIQLVIGEAASNRKAKSTLITEEPAQNLKGSKKQNTPVAVSIQQVSNDEQSVMTCRFSGECNHLRLKVDEQSRIIVMIPASTKTCRFSVTRSTTQATTKTTTKLIGDAAGLAPRAPVDLNALTRGSKAKWPNEIETIGFLGLEQNGYAVDTLTIPDSNPWNSWLRTTALDFFSDGRMAVATYGGDIWIVSNVDSTLKRLRWKRFAAGLYEPFGLRVIDDQIYATCKDRLVRLHDFNQDQEADYYENFSADPDVSINFHAFNFDLQTDDEGNFYYAKSGHGSDSKLPGTIYKISRDGKTREVFSTGFRTPNGLGMMPGNRLVGSDNQGQWMPASKINHLQKGRFYGWVASYSIPGMWEPDGGKIDLKNVIAPTDFERPIVWMPQEFDNSSGGQHWVEDHRFGPLNNHLLHTSFGKGWVSYLMTQEIDGVLQGAIARLPLDFRTGVMRARTNPIDGQVYATGLQGWNGGGRIGLRDNGVQRLRYTGNPKLMLTQCSVVAGGLELTFNQKITPESCQKENAFSIQHWNYHWRQSYGSAQYRPSDDQPGVETLQIESVIMDTDHRKLKLVVPNLVPVDQLHLKLEVSSTEGDILRDEVYWTIHRIVPVR